MWLLLKFQGYPPAVLFALLIHGGLLYLIIGGHISPSDFVDVEQPIQITAAVIQENPQRLRRLDLLEQQRARDQRSKDNAQAATQAANQQRQQKAAEQKAQDERQRLNREKQQAEELVKREQQANEKAEQEKIKLEAERETQRQAQLLAQEQAEESARQAETQRITDQVNSENELIGSYSAQIHDAVEQNWSRPPSARNGMTVLLGIQLVPTGEVVSVTIRESSGDPAVDRSAEQAVRRIGRFYELEGMPIGLFERTFRNFNLLFRPEDLLR